MIKGGGAIRRFGLIGAGDDRDVHDPATAFLSFERGLLDPMPEAAVVYREVAGFYFEACFVFVGAVVHKIFLPEQQPEQTLAMGAREDAEASVFVRAVVQMQPYIEHGHDAGTEEKIPRAIRMPAQLLKSAFPCIDILVDDEPVFFVFSYPAGIVAEESGKQLQARVLQEISEHGAKMRSEGDPLDERGAIGIPAKFQRDAVHFGDAFADQVGFYRLYLLQELSDGIPADELFELDDAVAVKVV